MEFTEYISSLEAYVEEMNKYLGILKKSRKSSDMSQMTCVVRPEDERIMDTIYELKDELKPRMELVELLITFSEKYSKYKNKLSDEEKQKLTRMLYIITASLANKSNYNDFIGKIHQSRDQLDDIKDAIPTTEKINGTDMLMASGTNMLVNILMGGLGVKMNGDKSRTSRVREIVPVKKLITDGGPVITEMD